MRPIYWGVIWFLIGTVGLVFCGVIITLAADAGLYVRELSLLNEVYARFLLAFVCYFSLPVAFVAEIIRWLRPGRAAKKGIVAAAVVVLMSALMLFMTVSVSEYYQCAVSLNCIRGPDLALMNLGYYGSWQLVRSGWMFPLLTLALSIMAATALVMSVLSFLTTRRLRPVRAVIYCRQCGKQMPSDSKYCNECGTSL
jgi:hypothetical protein